jgi:hypothetical protein
MFGKEDPWGSQGTMCWSGWWDPTSQAPTSLLSPAKKISSEIFLGISHWPGLAIRIKKWDNSGLHHWFLFVLGDLMFSAYWRLWNKLEHTVLGIRQNWVILEMSQGWFTQLGGDKAQFMKFIIFLFQNETLKTAMLCFWSLLGISSLIEFHGCKVS